MTSWQRRARMGIAAVGITCAILVYVGFRSRQPAQRPSPIQRLDPKAIVESTAGFLQQVRGLEQDYEIKFDRQLLYANGRAKLFDVVVSVKKKEGRDFIVTAREADAGENQRELRLTREVKLVASDGFELTTDHGIFNQDEGVVRADGPAAFRKGRMSGSGTAMTYNKNTDVLGIGQQATVTITDEQGHVTTDFAANAASLDRAQDILQLEGAVHVLRGEQVLDADRGTARLSENDEVVRFVELRGNSRVEGGSGTLDSMSARDIDLDYSDDGKALERVNLTERAAIALVGQDGAPGRQLTGGVLQLELASDGSVTHAIGTDTVRVGLPAAGATAARSIGAKSLDATGPAGKGLTDFHFADAVEYREDAPKGSRSRSARSRTLRLNVEEDAVKSAAFTGGVTFEEEGLTAGGAEAQYRPVEGTLQLSGRDAAGGPHVADDHVTIEAPFVDVALESRQMTARGGVKTMLRPEAQNAKAPAGEATASATRLPGLLQQDQAANVTSDRLQYDGSKGGASFTGNALLWQGETAVRANTIAIDQRTGNLIASGSARSTIAMDGGPSDGRANEIRYDDARRLISYAASPPATAGRAAAAPVSAAPPPAGAAATPTPGTAVPPLPPVPQGSAAPAPAPVTPLVPIAVMSRAKQDLRAQRIEVFLARDAGRVERVEAYVDVNARIATRTAAGNRLTYHANGERYDMSGIPGAPVKVVEGCRQITGKTLTFFTSTDRIIVNGNEEVQTRTSSAPCGQTPAR